MARQSASRHLSALETADPVSTVWHGREKWHHLESFLETGDVLPQAPWEMHAELRAAQMARTD